MLHSKPQIITPYKVSNPNKVNDNFSQVIMLMTRW